MASRPPSAAMLLAQDQLWRGHDGLYEGPGDGLTFHYRSIQNNALRLSLERFAYPNGLQPLQDDLTAPQL